MASKNSRYYVLEDLRPGMVVAKEVLSPTDQVILSEGTELTDKLIAGLRFWEIKMVAIRISSEARSREKTVQPKGAVQKQFFGEYEAVSEEVAQQFDQIRQTQEVPLPELKAFVQNHLLQMVNAVGVVNHLHMLQQAGGPLFQHAMNVAMICGVIGRWLDLGHKELQELVLAGLLHDIGKVQLPEEYQDMAEPSDPAQAALYRRHTFYGYQLLKKCPGIPENVKFAVFQHHEKMDGSGYPLGLYGPQIHPVARIVSVANLYDRRTAGQDETSRMSPFAVAEMMLEEMFGTLDPATCLVFLNNVRDYFTGNVVELSDGRVAEVVHPGRFMATRPMVRTMDGLFIDLEKERGLRILNFVQA